jgi:hypothetical protein
MIVSKCYPRLRIYRWVTEILHGIAMPQIWMTYEELAEMLICPVTEARERVHLERLDRKISRDGKPRVKLSMAMIGIFVERLKTIDLAMDCAVEDLRHVHGLMSEGAQQPKPLRLQWLRSHRSR